LLFAAATLIPIGVLAWFSVRILQQERDVERQRAREALEIVAGRFAISIDLRLSEIEAKLARGQGIRFTSGGIQSVPDGSLLYRPHIKPGEAEPPSNTFDSAEVEEFQRQNWAAAVVAYEKVAQSAGAEIRAAALVRLARVLRKSGDATAALRAYEALKALGAVQVDGTPAELIASQGRAKIFEETGAMADLRVEADSLAQKLYSGSLAIDRATFGLYVDLLQGWQAPSPPVGALASTEAIITLWEQWQSGELQARGRRLIHKEGQPFLAVWEQSVVWIATIEELQALLAPLANAQRLKYVISEIDGQSSAGVVPGVALTPGETRLPFILKVSALDARPSPARSVLLSGLILALALTLAAGVALYRVTTREILLARQQSDFVSAVSHEFRTPLTSMRHLTDLLVSRGVASEERRAQYYDLLAHETERLHRMVESLLSFGRIEAGAYAWQLEPADLGELARGIVEEFRREPDAAGREIVCEIGEELPPARIDRDAVSRALWNLLENAAKYSERGTPIRVFVRRRDGALLTGVEDQGAGIAVSEQSKIFQKFVRGSDAKRAGIRGVGIGLALVQHILEAHGGSVRVDSEPGRGSTFTLVIPCRES
jgi:signal transduction histidine kinase